MTKKRNSSAAKKLIPAAGMLAVSTMMLATSTYAWFTMNKEVTVTGMEVRTKVGSNLMIAPDSYNLATTNDNLDANYRTDIKQIRKCLLEPSSTINGVNYFYTVNASADGQKLDGFNWTGYAENATTAIENTVAGKTNYDPAFNLAYTLGGENGVFSNQAAVQMNDTSDPKVDGAAYGYIDYVFYIKATSDAANQKIVMTKCNLKHNGAALGMSDETTPAAIVDNAWRVALLSQAATSATDVTTAPAASDLVTILAPAGSENWVANSGVKDASTRDVLTKSGIATSPDKAVVGTIAAAGATGYYRVTVRLWLEGEDKTCNSATYAKLTTNYALDLEFKLENNDENALTTITTNSAWYGKLH